MIRTLVAGLLIVVFWAGTALADIGILCACGNDDGFNDVVSFQVRTARASYLKTVNEAHLAQQNLRNARMQQQVLAEQQRAAIAQQTASASQQAASEAAGRAASSDLALKRTLIIGTFIGAVLGVEQIAEEFIDICMKLEDQGVTTYLCPF